MKKVLKNTLLSILGVSVFFATTTFFGNHLSKINLEKPKKTKTEYSVSLHNHTTNLKLKDDYCLERLVESAINADLEIIALTDMNTDENWYYLRENSNRILKDYITEDIGNVLKIVRKQKPEDFVYIIKGQEFHKSKKGQGHVLLIGYDDSLKIPENSKIEEVIKIGKEKNALLILPHPFVTIHGFGGVGKEKLDQLYNEVDAIESFNAVAIYLFPFMNLSKYNKMAKDYAREKNIPGISCSDSKLENQIGCAYMLIEKENLDFSNGKTLIESIRTAIKNKNYKNYESYVPYWSILEFKIKDYLYADH